jgi:hypothetical protein
MKSEKGICFLLFICGHALVGAELRGTTAKMGDHDEAHSLPNTRTLQTALCSAHPACAALAGGEQNLIQGSMCCPTPYNAFLSCCAEPTTPDDRDDGPTENGPIIPAPIPVSPVPPVPAPTPTTPAVMPAKSPLCSAHPRCAELAGGADGLIPGSMCCPNPFGQLFLCCDP